MGRCGLNSWLSLNSCFLAVYTCERVECHALEAPEPRNECTHTPSRELRVVAELLCLCMTVLASQLQGLRLAVEVLGIWILFAPWGLLGYECLAASG